MFPDKRKKRLFQVMAVLFWIAIWQLISMRTRYGLFLASPLQTVVRLFELIRTELFLKSVLFTTGRILTGFFAAVLAGTVLAVLTSRWAWLEQLLMPLMRMVRAVPVVSFIILALILVSSRYLTQLISLLMALPIIYMNVRTGIEQTDRDLTEMSAVFQVPALRKLLYLYVPQIMPAFETGTALAMGFAWKSGIAAEVIGMPAGSIGERLQQAKIYLDTPDLFAWTVVIVALSVVTERIWRLLLKAAAGRCVLR